MFNQENKLQSNVVQPIESFAGLMQKLNQFRESQILITAHRLDIFNCIGHNSVTSNEVAKQLNANIRGIEIFLDALAALGVLEKAKHTYRNTKFGRDHLVSGGINYRPATLEHAVDLHQQWAKLEQAVLTGRSVRTTEQNLISNPEKNRSFIRAMAEIGQANAKILAANYDFSRYSRLLDLGGGPGTYSIEIIRQNPHLHAVIADVPLTLEVAREVVSAANLNEKITFHPVDFFDDPSASFGTGYDLVLISNVLHIEGPEENCALLQKVWNAMTTGSVLIHEAIIDENRITPPDRALFALNMLVNTERGNTYTINEMTSWLEEVGFIEVHFVDCFINPSLLVAHKPKNGE